MTTYNTGNPLGSSDPKDLYDNAQNLDTAVNSTDLTFNDRLGVQRKTYAGLEDMVEGPVNSALAYRNEAEVFRDQASFFSDEASANANESANSSVTAVAASEASGNVVFYSTYALANADVGLLPDQQIVEIFADENYGNRRTRYRKELGVLQFKVAFSINTQLLEKPSPRGDYFFSTFKKIYQLSQNQNVQLSLMRWGDSVANYAYRGVARRLINAFGLTGVAFQATTQVASGGASRTIGFNYTYSPLSYHYIIPSGGSVIVQRGGAAFLGSYFAAYLARRPGGGMATVELLNSSNAVVDSVIVDTDGALGMVKGSFTLASVESRYLRVSCSSGEVILLGGALINRLQPGIVEIDCGVGGTNLVQIDEAPKDVWIPMLADLQPDLGTYCARESFQNVQNHLEGLLNDFRTANPDIEFVLLGCNPWGGDVGLSIQNQPSWKENEAVRAVAYNTGFGFFDLYSTLPNIDKLDNAGDVHLSLAEELYVNSQVVTWLGLNYLTDCYSQAHQLYTNALFAQSLDLTATSNQNNTQRAFRMASSGDLDANASYYRSINFSYRGTDLLFSASDPNSGFIYKTAQSTVVGNSVGNYSADGLIFTVANQSCIVTKRRVGGTVVREHFQPQYDRSLGGIGLPGLAFMNADNAFNTSADYRPNEFRWAYDSIGPKLKLKILPQGEGSVRNGFISLNGVHELNSYLVASLPTAAVLDGSLAYASNGRCAGEGVGVGTGCVVVRKGSAWRTLYDNTVVAA